MVVSEYDARAYYSWEGNKKIVKNVKLELRIRESDKIIWEAS